MNTKVALGLVVALIVIAVAFAVFHKQSAPSTFTEQATSASATSSSEAALSAPVSPTATHTPAKPSVEVLSTTQKPDSTKLAFDTPNLVTNEARPTFTGTATTKTISVVIINSEAVGISGSWDIAVTNGHWSYTPAITLTPGTYTIQVAGGSKTINGSLIVTK